MPKNADKDARRKELEKRFEKRFEELTPDVLSSGDELALDRPGERLFLGFYSEQGIRNAIEAYGLDRPLREGGELLSEAAIEIDTTDPFLHALRIRDGDGHLIFELRARLGLGKDLGLQRRLAPLTIFAIEWLSAEAPHASFPPGRKPLPGQRHPGLGVGAELEALLLLAARRVGAAALLSHPQYFHNAWLYQPRWRFVDPAEDGRFGALVRDLGSLGVWRLSWAIHLGLVRDESGAALQWRPGPLLLPRTRPARSWFETTWYRSVRFAEKARRRYAVDAAELEDALARLP